MSDSVDSGLRDRPVSGSAFDLGGPGHCGIVVEFPRLVSSEPKGADVKRTDLFGLFEAGSGLKAFKELRTDKVAANRLFVAMLDAGPAADRLLSDFSDLLGLAKEPLVEFRSALSELDKRFFRDDKGGFKFPDAEVMVEGYMLYSANAALTSFEVILRAELRGAATYSVPKRGTYNTGDLVDRASETFPDIYLPYIGKVALAEYQAAGRCFAFGLHTASGYHSCRAAEAVLRAYYRAYVGEIDAGTETWGALISKLEATDASAETLGQIRHLKDFHRNPLSHLRSVLEEPDADMLLSGAKVVICAMARDLMTKKEGVEPPLALVPPNADEAA